jgi:hypothetical protein
MEPGQLQGARLALRPTEALPVVVLVRNIARFELEMNARGTIASPLAL